MVHQSEPLPPRLPDKLRPASNRLAGLVDFHDEDLSGSWFAPEDGKLHIGVATDTGRALLASKGLADNPLVVVEHADRSLAAGQRYADRYVQRSVLGKKIVGWGALPEGDGIELFVRGDHLTKPQLNDLGALPLRVLVTLGQQPATLD